MSGIEIIRGSSSSTSPSPGPWVWEQSDSDTDWGLLSDCIIVEPQSEPKPEPTPPPPAFSIDFRRSRVENWVVQRAKYSTKLPNQAGPSSQTTGSVLGNAATRTLKKGPGHVCAREVARRDRISEVSSSSGVQIINAPEPSTSSSSNSSNLSQRRLRRSQARDMRIHQYLRSLEGSSAKLFALAAVLTDRSQQAHVASDTEFVSRVSRISTTMAELVTKVEEALQMTKKR